MSMRANDEENEFDEYHNGEKSYLPGKTVFGEIGFLKPFWQVRCENRNLFWIFPGGIMNGGKSYLNKLRIIFPSLLKGSGDRRKWIHTFFLGFFLEIGIDLDRENIGFYEGEFPYVSSVFRYIFFYCMYLDIGVVCIDLVFQKLRISRIDDEKKPNRSSDIRYLETEFRCRVGFPSESFMLFERIVKYIQNLLRHKNSFFVEAIDRDFEDSFGWVQMSLF